jgi:hypothetical protein
VEGGGEREAAEFHLGGCRGQRLVNRLRSISSMKRDESVNSILKWPLGYR